MTPDKAAMSFGNGLRVVKELNAYVGRGMRQGWLRGKDADHALDVVEGQLKATLDAELERCKQVQALFDADPDMKFGEALRRVYPAHHLTGSGWFCSACGEPRPCDTHEYKP